MNDMQRQMFGSNGAHMVPSWDDVWAACDRSDAVLSYDEDIREIQWVGGEWQAFVNTHDALNAISAMEAN